MIVNKQRICFIDYAKAFDCVDHEKLWITMRPLGFPEHIIHLNMELYKNQQALVRTENGNSDLFSIEKGVRQGCILFPDWFNIYAELIMRNALADFNDGIVISGNLINNLRYADDTTHITTSCESCEEILNKVKAASEKVGLYLNVKKTKIMIIGSDERPIIKVDN